MGPLLRKFSEIIDYALKTSTQAPPTVSQSSLNPQTHTRTHTHTHAHTRTISLTPYLGFFLVDRSCVDKGSISEICGVHVSSNM